MKDRKALQIASSINLVAQLPDGDALVHILGAGDETSNLEALSKWIQGQEDLTSLEHPDFMIEQLIHRLHNKLDGFNSCLYE